MSKINLQEMRSTIAQSIADGLNELGYSVDVPNEKGEMLFGPECHDVRTMVDQIYTAALNDLQGKVDVLLLALSNEWPGLYGEVVNEHNKKALAEFKKDQP
jgi:muramidase (phage lysozyme)